MAEAVIKVKNFCGSAVLGDVFLGQCYARCWESGHYNDDEQELHCCHHSPLPFQIEEEDRSTSISQQRYFSSLIKSLLYHPQATIVCISPSTLPVVHHCCMHLVVHYP
ncbi:hypothetical protein S83_005509 [Arachis hypogaea]